MTEVISIDITSRELEERARRVARARRFESVDRVPVCPNIYMRYWLPRIGGSYTAYFEDPETMLRMQIYGQKWVLENIQSDHVFEPIYVDFQNALDASSLGCDTALTANGSIWIDEGWVRSETELRRLTEIDPLTTNLGARALEFAARMRTLADRYAVLFLDGVKLYPARHPLVNFGSLGPFTTAAQLAGLTELCESLYLRPGFAQDILSIVTDKIIDMLTFCRRVQGMDMLWLADDYAGNLSLEQFREYVLPCLRRIRSHFPNLYFSFHMCGKVDHLVPALANELHINEFSMFGYQVNKQLVQELMGGRTVLMGNVNPMNIHAGTAATVMEESLEALRIFGQGRGGFILSDGANIAPDSPPENISAMWHAACRFAAEQTASRQAGLSRPGHVVTCRLHD
jgi:hypothetical protein